MKDIVISSKKIKRELWILLACFVVAEGVNLGAIIAYSRPASELYSMIGYVLVVTIVIYLLLWIVRLLALLICKTLKLR